MTRNGKKKTTAGKSNRVSVEIKDVKFESSEDNLTGTVIPENPENTETAKSEKDKETTTTSTTTSTTAASGKLEKILSELESGCLAECSKDSKSHAVGYWRKKMAA